MSWSMNKRMGMGMPALAGLAVLALAGCGGSDGGGSQSVTPSQGVFGDSAVRGIHFKTATQEGDTDAAGTFRFLPGETVTFSLFGTVLGTAAASANVTPADLKNGSGAALSGSALTSMLQVLQSLDSDHDPGNGIAISATAFPAGCSPTDASACAVSGPLAWANFANYIDSVPSLARNATLTQAVSAATLGTRLYAQASSTGAALPPYANWGTLPIAGSGYGSALTPEPGKAGFFYGLTDRGPNVTAPDGSNKIEPYLDFQPAIAELQIANGKAMVVRTIGLSRPDGTKMNGRVNPEADTAETIFDVNGNALPKSDAGFDPEGIVALSNGTFWISDEYGPYIVHFDATGKEIERFNPYAATNSATVHPLPSELKRRKPNKGMEGLTVTPDGKYLVGIMQSALDKNNGTGVAAADAKGAGNVAVTRVVKVSLTDPTDVHEYLYSLHTKGQTKNPGGQAVSEITALPDGTFIVDERDGNFEGTSDGTANGTARADKNLWKLDLANATDVGPKSPLLTSPPAGHTVTYDATSGLDIDGKSIEDIAGTKSDADAIAALAAVGVGTGAESLYLNYAALFTSIDPKGMYFGHDKVEGVAVDPADPNIIYISNDSDFGITDEPSTATAPFPPSEKFLADGRTQDFGEIVRIDLTKVPARFRQ
ncbi:MAG TPA: esterase-like activity of phytase family protein [Ramlibacter sp.]|uniref:esterase-like activity of phytase family protein n=1 Tax=Ramlibacter sp. TaxID=1917967 RepID=UPI002BD02D37|nr:esterase-like activity of phytase family protein [Ramlibacter sp.]HVZ45178.1 esterase-like activity of phytase family protein [Ramlibacter sp.]